MKPVLLATFGVGEYYTYRAFSVAGKAGLTIIFEYRDNKWAEDRWESTADMPNPNWDQLYRRLARLLAVQLVALGVEASEVEL